MKFYYKLSRAAILFIFGFVILFTTADSAHAERGYWPYSNAECQSKTNDFERDCTGTQKFALRDMATKQISVAYIHKSKNLTKSELKTAVKLQRLSKADQKAAYKYKNQIIIGGLTYDYDEAKLEGLRNENGEVLLKTVFSKIHPMSPTHSLVQLFNGEMKIVEHVTHKLSGTNYTSKDMFHLRALDEETGLHYEHIFFVTVKGGEYSANAVPLLPDMTFGNVFEYVEVKTWHRDLAEERGNGFLISVNSKPLTNGKWSDLVFDEWHQPVLNNPNIVSLAVKYGNFYKTDGTYDSTVSMVAPVGEIAEDRVAQRGGLTEKKLPLYWPYKDNGALMHRPSNILGMMPIKRSVRSGQYYDAWLVVFRDDASYDYAVATFYDTSAASNVASQIDTFEVLDDVYFRNGYGGNGRGYALRSKTRSGIVQPWYGYLPDESPRANIFAILNGDNIRTAYQSSTAKGAIDARVLNHRNTKETLAREQAEREAQMARYEAESRARDERLNRAQFQAEFGWRNPTTSASQCAASYAALQEEYMRNTSNPYFQSKKAWMVKYEANGSGPCDTPPRTSSGESTYTLRDGIRDMGNAAVCTRQERRCVSDGQYERCSMVTVKTC